MYARSFIDSLDFARNGEHLSGELPVAELPRLLDVLETPQGVLHYTVQGGVDKQGIHFLDVSVTGLCRLRCQRCLNGLDYPVQLDTRLLLRDQAGLDALDDDAADGKEVLLSLPIAPKHELGACQATDGQNTQLEEINPFAVLAKLKRN